MSKSTHYLKQELDARMKADSQLFDWLESGSLDGVWFWDLENQEHEWLSPKFKEIFGYAEDEIPHTSEWWQKNIFEEDLPAVLENFEKHCADPTHPYDQVVRYRHKNGSTVWVRCRGKVIFDDTGKAIRMIGAHTDLTDMMKVKDELAERTAELTGSIASQQAMFEAILDSIIVIGHTGIIIDVNHSTERLFEYSRDELIGRNVKILMDSQDANQHDGYLSHHLKTGHSSIIGEGREVVARKKSGKLIHAFLSIAKFVDSGGVKFVGTLRDISDQVRHRIDLEHEALHDPLTGLATRRLLEQNIEQFISECIRDDKQFSMLFIDLDRFKPVNDDFGHDIGDEVLKIIAKRLNHAVRARDVCARLGGDEFVVLCEPQTMYFEADVLMEKLKNTIKQPINIEGKYISLDASIGRAQFPENGQSKDELIKFADEQMYRDKNGHVGSSQSIPTQEELVSATYISHSLVNAKDVECECANIRKVASKHNAEKQISGVLLYSRNRFIQRLEGRREDIDELLDRIKTDPRHRNYSLLSYSVLSRRYFEDWSEMAVITDVQEFDELEKLLINLEVRGNAQLNDQESRYVVDYIKNFKAKSITESAKETS